MKTLLDHAPRTDSMAKTKFLFSPELVARALGGKIPSEHIGQNFLVDADVALEVARHTLSGAEVVEVGTGIGNLTRVIAQHGAARVITLDIDPQLRPAQEIVLQGVDNVEIRQQDAVKFKYQNWVRQDPDARHQVMGNIPYHISEPLVTRLAQNVGHIDNVTLIAGEKLADALTSRSPESDRYTKLTFVASVFDIEITRRVPRSCSYPVPPTDSVVLSMTPKEVPADESSTSFGLRKAIVASSDTNLSLAKVINNYGNSGNTGEGKQLGKDLSHKRDRRQERSHLSHMRHALNDMPVSRRRDGESTKELMGAWSTNSGLVDRLGLPQSMLGKPFNRLDNQEVRLLAEALQRI